MLIYHKFSRVFFPIFPTLEKKWCTSKKEENVEKFSETEENVFL
jgi:hypothetical protein